MSSSSPIEPPRFIDLRIDWLAQYSPETNLFGPETTARAIGDLPRIEGYLGATSAAFLMLGRDREDWSRRPDSWSALADLIARSEAEFPGRVLRSREDYSHWQSEPDGLTWIVMGVGGFGPLIRTRDDLKRLSRLFERGIRVFQPFSQEEPTVLDDNGIFLHFLATLEELNPTEHGPRPILDLAGMDTRKIKQTLAWFEEKDHRAGHILLSHSAGRIDMESIARMRSLGGFTVLAASTRSFDSLAALRFAIELVASIPIPGITGYTKIGLASDAFGGGKGLDGIETVPDLGAWAMKTLEPSVASALLRDNATALIAQCVGV